MIKLNDYFHLDKQATKGSMSLSGKLEAIVGNYFVMVVVKAVKVTNKDRIHIKILYLSEDQRAECLKDLLAWIRKYGSREVIETANKAPAFCEL